MTRSAIPVLLVACAVSTSAVAQRIADDVYVVVSASSSPGATMNSTNYKSSAATGEGVVTGASKSANFEVKGGYVASFGVDVSTRPTVIAVRPRYRDLANLPETIAFAGTGLDLSTITGVTIGGVPAVRGPSTVSWMLTQLVKQKQPGFLTVEVIGSFGKTVLPEAIGIRPLIEAIAPPPRFEPFSFSVRGTQNDSVLLAASLGTIPAVRLPPFRHSFFLDPSQMIVLPPRTITDPTGELTFTFPAIPLPATVPYSVQALVTTTTATYQPGAFTDIRTF